jgi:Protein-L-isoaspartate(D-aspartate) O-methyltransferase (PCMT)
VLQPRLEADPRLLAELTRLVEEAKADPQTASFVTSKTTPGGGADHQHRPDHRRRPPVGLAGNTQMTAPLNPQASTAASLLAGTTLGGQDRLAAWPGLVRLVALLHQTAAADPALHAALVAVSAGPEDPDRVAALAYAVDALASRDSGLRAELAGLLDQACQHSTARELVTQIAGHARVGKLVTIGRAGAIHVHLPSPPPATLLDQLPPTRVGPLVANLPPRNPTFTGRVDLLDLLHQRLHPGQPAALVKAQALHGLGGVGKTQLALDGHTNVTVWRADGRRGHPPGAPYDRLVAWAQAPHAIPAAWTEQVHPGGIIVVPLRRRIPQVVRMRVLAHRQLSLEQQIAAGFIPLTAKPLRPWGDDNSPPG